MPVRTIGLLPEIFRTDPNEKFFNATIEQLTNEPNLKRINGYIGKKFTVVNKTGDNYIEEPNADRNKYQLEPAVVVPNEDNSPNFTGHYIDLLNKIRYYGGNVNDQTRLFTNEHYSYNPQIDYDKFVNFSQYYWLPTGPTAVSITSDVLPSNEDIEVTRTGSSAVLATGVGYYEFSQIENQTNPLLILARGGTYNFNVNQAGNPFWIQTEPGTDGQQDASPNFSSREIFGVVNNGEDDGTVTFNVPDANAQQFYTDMTDGLDINFAITGLTYNDIQYAVYDDFIETYGGLDNNVDIDSKRLIFIDNSDATADWTGHTVDDTAITADADTFTADDAVVLSSFRTYIWDITVTDGVIYLTPFTPLLTNIKHRITEGVMWNDRAFHLDGSGDVQLVPLITALADTFYYQDENDENLLGIIKLVNTGETYVIDIESDILGMESYTSPNGIRFTNGLKVSFGPAVTPTYYQNRDFYVEGVGDKISLTAVDTLVTPEPFIVNAFEPFDSEAFDTTPWEGGFDAPTTKDYITINRASVDNNVWSRGNRWFHIDVIKLTAEYNGTDVITESDARANRPIIEFNANLKLYNYGLVAIDPIDLQDVNETDALSNVNGSAVPLFIDGIEVKEGWRVVFPNDLDDTVKKTIYTVEFIDVDVDGNEEINLIPDATAVEEGSTFLVKEGLVYGGNVLYLDGGTLVSAQAKTDVNQAPLFDVFDTSGNKLSDTSVYVNSSFRGSEIFSYAVGTGLDDPSLGFPLTYRNFQTVGDIVFENDFDSDTFTFTIDNITNTDQVNIGWLHKTTDLTSFEVFNMWTPVAEKTYQEQLFTYDNEGETLYRIDVDPVPESLVKHYHVYLDYIELDRTNFEFVTIDELDYIQINTDLTNVERIDILLYSKEVSTLAEGFEIPSNLENNAQNIKFDSLTLGQIRNHVGSAYGDSNLVDGVFPGSSNLRDLPFTMQAGGDILQHSAGLPYANLFLLDQKANFVDAVQHAQAEYARFKYKFIDLATRLDNLDPSDPVAATDQIIEFINDVKTEDFPWYASDMVPYGTNKTETTYNVVQTVDRQYELLSLYDNTTASNTAALVYVNDVQLVSNIDFVYNSTIPYITILDTYPLVVGDVIKLVEYPDTDGNWIPETPSKMGMYPAFAPLRFTDDSFVSSPEVIRGHDGSITPVYGDFRDDLLLELEKRIYNNIKTEFDESRFSINDVKPGKFRDTDYTLEEFNNTLARYFFKFVGENKLDYRNDPGFDADDPFTYNYRKFSDYRDQETLQGSWKAVFNYYFDCLSPHTRPWEMLGFSARPLWWIDTYGPAPYTSGNLILWQDLEAGRIRSGDRAGIDTTYARPGLLDIIPVDAFGNLLSPNDFLVSGTPSKYANEPYIAGEQGPVEQAWRNSSQFPFAMQIILGLLKPAEYFGLFADLQRYNFNQTINQYLFDITNQRLTQNDITLNGELAGVETGSGIVHFRYRTASYLNWISDYVKSDGVSPTSYVGNMLTNYKINLAYKMAGFTDKNLLKIIAEQSSPSSTTSSVIVPDEDFYVVLNSEAPLVRVSYSSVIIEKTNTGFRVDGYNLSNPHFTILPSIENNNTSTLTVLDDRVTLYKSYSNQPVSVPYGFEFTTKEDVVDFLVSYNRFLERQGFLFNEFDNIVSEVKNWIMSGKEFLYWTQQGWGTGNVLVVNPLGSKIHMNTAGAVVGEIRQTTPHSLTDQNFHPIPNNNFSVKRVDNEFNLEILDGRAIGFLDVDLIQQEHILVFNNITVFNDIIFQAELGNRQLRLRLVGYKSNNWNGNLAPAGYIYNDDNVPAWAQSTDYRRGDLVIYKNKFYSAMENIAGTIEFDFSKWTLDENQGNFNTGLVPNFSNLARVPEDFYEINDVNLESQTDLFGKGLIGFRNREYFEDAGIDDTSQVKFYQGMIQKKGTSDAIDAFTRARLRNDDTDIDLFEEWALRAGSYGAVDSTQYVETKLDESEITANPALLVFKNSGDATTVDAKNVYPTDIFDVSGTYDKDMFLTQVDKQGLDLSVKTAGPPKLSDAAYRLFSWDDFEDLNAFTNSAGVGELVWVAKETNNDWNIFRIASSGLEIKTATRTGQVFEMDTNFFHNLTVGDRILIRGLDDLIDGWYVVSNVKDLNTFSVTSSTDEADLEDFVDITGAKGQLYYLVSNRFDDTIGMAEAIGTDVRDNEKYYVDDYDGNNGWAVFNKSTPWSYNNRTAAKIPENGMRFGSTVAVSEDGLFAYGGSPLANSGVGSVSIVSKNNFDQYASSILLRPTNASTSSFGTSISVDDGTHLAVGAPSSDSSAGQVLIYKQSSGISAGYNLRQIIPGPVAGAEFGSTVELSTDGNWLYVAELGTSAIRAYMLVKPESAVSEEWITSTPALNPVFTITEFSVPTPEALHVTDDLGRTYINGIDYTITEDVLSADNDTLLADGDIRRADQRNTYTITFAAAFVYGTEPDITITFEIRDEYYVEVDSLSIGLTVDADTETADIDTITADDRSTPQKVALSTTATGDQLVVGSIPVAGAGVVTLYDRQIEKFIADDQQTSFRIDEQFDPLRLKVFQAGNELTVGTDYTVDLNNGDVILNTPAAEGDIVQIDTNAFVVLDTLEPPAGTDHYTDDFGYDVHFCGIACNLLVGMPNYDFEGQAVDSNNGAAIHYTNQSQRFGTIRSTIQNPALTITHNIRINDILVRFTGTDAESVADDINSAEIPGVTASEDDGYLTITSDSVLEFEKLTIKPGRQSFNNSGFEDLGFEIFPYATTIESPLTSNNERFGESVYIDTADGKAVVGSSQASTRIETTVDVATGETTFDSDSTRFGALVPSSGSVTVFEYLPVVDESITNLGSYIFAQQLVGDSVQAGDEFGASIAVNDNLIIVGAPVDEIALRTAGTLYAFENPDRSDAWTITRTLEDKIEVKAINRIFLYNNSTKLIETNMDFIDPAKSKILGIANQEIDFKTSFDPAKYNISANPDLANEKIHWTKEQIGRVWWDLSTIRYLEYEQDDVAYKFSNWGAIFPGSSVDVYEWVETDVLPSQYVAAGYNGTPKDVDDSLYVEISFIDTQTGLTNTRYYYWVKDKTEVDTVQSPFRTITVSTVANMIRTPKSQGIPYAAILDSSSMALYNVTDYLAADDMVMHVDYDVLLNDNVIHSEYALLQEESDTEIPSNIIDKMIDSLAGINALGASVPDPNLTVNSRLGISIRPRQTMFDNRIAAITAAVLTANRFMAQSRIVDNRTMASMYSSEAFPAATSGEYDETVDTIEDLNLIDVTTKPTGHKVLVLSDSSTNNFWVIYELLADDTWTAIRVQSYDTTRYWTAIDWYATGYSEATVVDINVATRVEIQTIASIPTGTIIKVADNGNGQWELIEKTDLGFSIVGVEASTVEIASALYDPEAGGGFDAFGFDLDLFDSAPLEETRRIMTALFNEIFIDDLASLRNEFFFVLIRYILAEQSYVDWLFKSSFVSVKQSFDGLQQFPVYQETTQTFVEDYINEIKPYHTKIREFLLNQRITDIWDGDVTDFDIPAYYDFGLSRFRQPNGNEPGDDTLLSTLPEYDQWYNNHKYYVSAISVEDGGSGYDVNDPPVVVITGGGGSGAAGTAVVEAGEVIRIDVTNPGSGYTSTPAVSFNTGSGTAAKAYVYLENDEVRKLKTTIRFDRVSYDTNLVDWEANTAYTAGTLLAHNGNAWSVNTDYTSGATFTSTNLTLISIESFDNANDRTWAAYQPTAGMIDRNLRRLYTGIEYDGAEIVGPRIGVTPEDELDAIIEGGDLTTNFDGVRPGEIDFDGGAFIGTNNVYGPEELLPGRVFETIDFQVYSTIATDEATSNTQFALYDPLDPENTVNAGVCYRMFQKISGEWDYLRMSNTNSALLTEDLETTDTYIQLDDTTNINGPTYEVRDPGYTYSFTSTTEFDATGVDATVALAPGIKLQFVEGAILTYGVVVSSTYDTVDTAVTVSMENGDVLTAGVTDFNIVIGYESPGVLFVNGERIEFFGMGVTTATHPHFPSMTANSVWQLMRGTQGTSIPTLTASGSRVADGSIFQAITGTANTRIDSVIDPWKVWSVVVNSNTEFNALDPEDYPVGATLLHRHLFTNSKTQEEYEIEEVSGVKGWVRTALYVDNQWHTPDPFAVNVTDGGPLQTAVTAPAAFLQLELGFPPSLP